MGHKRPLALHKRSARPHRSLPVAPDRLPDHSIHAHAQPAGTGALPNKPYVPCCHRNDDCAARVGRGGEKSAAADQPIANTGTEPRENVMGTMMGCCGGRQSCHRRYQSQRNRRCKSFHIKSPLSLHVRATHGSTSLVKEGAGDLVAKLLHPSSFLPWRGARATMVAFLIEAGPHSPSLF
jgi:hypothetical protein